MEAEDQLNDQDRLNEGPVSQRFRGFLPVVVDVETAGFNADTDALLEIAAVIVLPDENQQWQIDQVISKHIQPFAGANLDPSALEFNGIDPDHPFRKQIAETETQALGEIFKLIRKKVKQHHCRRAVLVGHNAAFDLG
ncbi:MAG: ribonuclease T, partial [Thiotrichales bacterium]|nr:ribonuclease T [Thiotrichales bacterium]